MKLSLWQKFVLLINGSVFLRWEKQEGWSGYLKIYAVKCPKHGLYEDYPHGYNALFECPKCQKEAVEKYKKHKPNPSFFVAVIAI